MTLRAQDFGLARSCLVATHEDLLDTLPESGLDIKVLFIGAWGRSGTTILDRTLGEIDGVISLGELRYIWDRGLLENLSCGCGKPFRSCDFWSEVIRDSFGSVDVEFAREMARQRDSLHSRDILLSVLPEGNARLMERISGYSQAMKALYQSLQKMTDAALFIDSSKFPSHGYLLDQLESIHLSVLHLVRDPRAVAYSWGRTRVFDLENNPTIMIDKHSTARSAWFWGTWNFLIEFLWGRRSSYRRIHYEKFVRDPSAHIASILDLVKIEAPEIPVHENNMIHLGIHHTVSGNPSRFQTGEVKLRIDDEWANKIRLPTRLSTDMLTLPLLIHYRYPLW